MQRQPISDIVEGVVSRLDDGAALSEDPPDEGEILARGEITLRYGYPFMFRPDRWLVPDLVVADRGEMLTGETAWDFIIKRGHLFPRADVLGYDNDGADAALFLKELDLASPCATFAYRHGADRKPVAGLAALICAETASIPSRLLDHLPRFDSLDAWRAHVR